jgi:multiple sugar transport system permease protein
MVNDIREQERRTGWLLTIPALLILALVFAYPILRAVWQSFFAINLSNQLRPEFAGLANYARMFEDGRFWGTLWNSVVFTVSSVLLELILGMGIALVLNQTFRGRGIVRTIAILPWALPTALIALAWTWIFNDQYGVVNDLLSRIGFQSGINWLGNPTLAMLSVIIADVWKTTPFISILLLAGLQSIPNDLYEAQAIDGATPWQSFRQVTLPLLLPQVVIALLFRLAQAFGIFDLISVMTGGGPGGATETVSLYIYSTVMRYLDFGYGAALVVVTFLLLVLVVILANYLLRLSRQRASRAPEL